MLVECNQNLTQQSHCSPSRTRVPIQGATSVTCRDMGMEVAPAVLGKSHTIPTLSSAQTQLFIRVLEIWELKEVKTSKINNSVCGNSLPWLSHDSAWNYGCHFGAWISA